jgi:glycosyltransferase involved in cell wall biosynthesis
MTGILILDTSYTLKIIKERNLFQALHSRKLGGFFKKVISVNPLSGLSEKSNKNFGKPTISKIDSNHIFISGKVGISASLNLCPPLNFLLSQIKLLKMLTKLAIQNKVKIIRVGDPYYLGILGLILSRVLNVPLVMRIPGNFDIISKVSNRPIFKRLFRHRFIEKIVEKFVLPRCHLVICANRTNRDYAIANGAKKNLITIFRYGNLIHPYHWTNPKKRKLSKEVLRLLGLNNTLFISVVSRLEKVKGVDSVIKAAAELKRKNYKIKFLIIGDGSQMNNLKNLSIKLDVSKNIIFIGNKDQVWISKILPSSLAVMSPHGGRSLTECCLAGVPIIAYDFDWQKEIIKNNLTGFLIKNDNWKGLVKKTIFILKNKKKSNLLGKNARTEVMKMMNLKKIEDHEKLKYSEVIKNYNSNYI